MIFTDLEKAAILQGLVKLAYVDNNLAPSEESLYMKISEKLGANDHIIRLASQLEKNPSQAIGVIQSFSQDKKELFSALLYMMMNADGVNNLLEQGFIEGAQLFYDIPEITPEKADRIFKSFMAK